jgi:hypothetical protein
MYGIGVGPVEAPVVDPQAVSTVINTAALISRFTQIATGSRYVSGMSRVTSLECPMLICDWTKR